MKNTNNVKKKESFFEAFTALLISWIENIAKFIKGTTEKEEEVKSTQPSQVWESKHTINFKHPERTIHQEASSPLGSQYSSETTNLSGSSSNDNPRLEGAISVQMVHTEDENPEIKAPQKKTISTGNFTIQSRDTGNKMPTTPDRETIDHLNKKPARVLESTSAPKQKSTQRYKMPQDNHWKNSEMKLRF